MESNHRLSIPSESCDLLVAYKQKRDPVNLVENLASGLLPHNFLCVLKSLFILP